MLARVLSLIYWVFLGLSCAVMFWGAVLIWVLTRWWDRKQVIQHWYSGFWASIYTWVNPFWRLEVEGREHVRPGERYVLIANHSSFLDILVIYRLSLQFKWVSKIEMFRIPFVGWNMALNNYVALRRGEASSIREMIRDCVATLEAGYSVLIFPEGTRSTTGELGRFTPGAFKIAQRAGVPIVPIVLENTAAAMPKGGFPLGGPLTLRARILPPIPVAELAEENARVLADRTRERYQSELAG